MRYETYATKYWLNYWFKTIEKWIKLLKKNVLKKFAVLSAG